MEENQKLQFKMFSKVMDTMDHHVSSWIDVPELSLTNDTFARLYKKLADLVEEEKQLVEPQNEVHLGYRHRLEKQLKSLLGVVQIFAEDTKNKKLQKRVNVKPAALDKSDNEALIKLALIINKTALQPAKNGTKKPTSLSEYGLTEEMAASLKKDAMEIAEIKRTSEKFRKTKKKIQKKETKLTDKISWLLKKRMDRMVNIFEAKDPAFHKDYMSARIIEKPAKKNAVPKKEAQRRPAQEKTEKTKKSRTRQAVDKSLNSSPGKMKPAAEVPVRAQTTQKKQAEKKPVEKTKDAGKRETAASNSKTTKQTKNPEV